MRGSRPRWLGGGGYEVGFTITCDMRPNAPPVYDGGLIVKRDEFGICRISVCKFLFAKRRCGNSLTGNVM